RRTPRTKRPPRTGGPLAASRRPPLGYRAVAAATPAARPTRAMQDGVRPPGRQPAARLRARVRAALRAAWERPGDPLVVAALRAAAARSPAVRLRAAVRACTANARLDAAARGSRRSAWVAARDRVG